MGNASSCLNVLVNSEIAECLMFTRYPEKYQLWNSVSFLLQKWVGNHASCQTAHASVTELFRFPCRKAESVLLNTLILFVIVEWLIPIAELAIFIWGGLHNLGYYNLLLRYNYMTRAASTMHTEMIVPHIMHTTYVYQFIFEAGCVLLSWSGICRSSILLLPSLNLPAIVAACTCHVPVILGVLR